MNSTKWNSLAEFTKYLGREGICHVKEDEKDGLMVAWRDTSVAATTRRNEIAEQEAAEARSGAGEDKLLKKMAKRAQEEAEATKAKRATANAVTPTIDEKPDVTEEAPPVKLSFGMKAKAAPAGKAGLGQMKSQSIFKRKKDDALEQKPVKKVKL